MESSQTRTIEQVFLGLVEKLKESCGFPVNCTCVEHDCPCHGLGFKEVHGKVAKLPMLREDCIGILIDAEQSQTLEDYCCMLCGWLDGQFVHDENCEPCQGRGWLPVTTVDALLEAGKPWYLGVRWNGVDWEASWGGLTVRRALNNADKTMALALALEAAEGIEVADA